MTNFILRWGNSSTVYWHRTVTTASDGNTFKDGWNFLRFDWNGATEVGTVDVTAMDFLRLTVTKSASLAADTDWRVDDIVVRNGRIYDVIYYTKYGWTDSSDTYIEDSTTTTDLVVADTDEIDLIATKAAEYASQELKDYEDVRFQQAEYDRLKGRYLVNNPSEALKKRRHYSKAPRFSRFRAY